MSPDIFARLRALTRIAGCALALLSLAPSALRAQQSSSISGYTFVDRDNNGLLTFNDQPNPEIVLPGVKIELYSISGSTQTLLTSVLTNSVGNYQFTGLLAGTYGIRQIQPTEFIDGLHTVGAITSLANVPNPPGSNVGTAPSANFFTGIILPAGVQAKLYNFGERGLLPQFVSKRFLFGSAPPPVTAPPVEIIPEPASLALLASAVAALATVRRRSRK